MDDCSHDVVAVARGNLSDQAEVEQHELASIRTAVHKHQVPRVRVSVEETPRQQLVQEDLLSVLDPLLDPSRFKVRELSAINPLGHQDAASGVLHVDIWDDHTRAIWRLGNQLCHLDLVEALVSEVQLGIKTLSKSLDQSLEVGALRGHSRGQLRDNTRRLPHDIEILADERQGARALNLDSHHVAAFLQLAFVDLRERGRSYRLLRELHEDFTDRPAELSLDQGPGYVGVKCRDFVLQAAELIHHLWREHVWPNAEHLAELDEGRTQRLNGVNGLPRQISLFGLEPASDRNSESFGDPRRGQAQELSPATCELPRVLPPIGVQLIDAVHQGQSILIHLVANGVGILALQALPRDVADAATLLFQLLLARHVTVDCAHR
mmetsp:Transcript_153531/g.492052  ORF Transcript_153531/g.492052 Transcript_153531/m.492052 type:complete len:379 (+) Transcript_153531:1117-2253(+)